MVNSERFQSSLEVFRIEVVEVRIEVVEVGIEVVEVGIEEVEVGIAVAEVGIAVVEVGTEVVETVGTEVAEERFSSYLRHYVLLIEVQLGLVVLPLAINVSKEFLYR